MSNRDQQPDQKNSASAARAGADYRLELAIGYMLRIGVLVAAAVVFLGGVLYLHQQHGARRNYVHFHGVSPALRQPASVLAGVRHLDAESVIALGLLLLIATPIVRVLFAIGGFLLERDWLYTGVSLAVLLVLLYSLFAGR